MTGKLPDLRGEFIRGLDNGRGVDSGRTLGSYQGDLNKSHYHHTTTGYNADESSVFGGDSGLAIVGAIGEFAKDNFGRLEGNELMSRTSLSGGNETRPRNIAMKYIIKYKIGDGRLS